MPVEGFEPPPPLPRDDGSRGGHHQAEDEEPRYHMSRRDNSEMRRFEEDQGAGQDEPDQDPGMDPMAAIKQASADEMMELVKTWVTASPENKAEIMKRLPDLTSLLM